MTWATSAADDDRAALELAGGLEHVARLVRSGSSIIAALEEAGSGPPGGFLAEVAARRATGAPFTDAIAEAVRSGGRSAAQTEDRRLAGAVLSAVHVAGGPGAAAIDRSAATVRERVAIRADRRAHAAQARLSARILSLLPVGFTTWTVATDRRVGDFLLATAPGLACLVSGAALAGVGWRWMRRLVEAA